MVSAKPGDHDREHRERRPGSRRSPRARWRPRARARRVSASASAATRSTSPSAPCAPRLQHAPQLTAREVVEEPAGAPRRRRGRRAARACWPVSGSSAGSPRRCASTPARIARWTVSLIGKRQAMKNAAIENTDGREREDRADREQHLGRLRHVRLVAEPREQRERQRRARDHDELRHQPPQRQVLRLATLAGVELVVVDHVGLDRGRQEQPRAEARARPDDHEQTREVVARSEQEQREPAGDAHDEAREPRVQLADALGQQRARAADTRAPTGSTRARKIDSQLCATPASIGGGFST